MKSVLKTTIVAGALLVAGNGLAGELNPVLHSFMTCHGTNALVQAELELFTAFSPREVDGARGNAVALVNYKLPGDESPDRMMLTDVEVTADLLDCGGRGFGIRGDYRLSGGTGSFGANFCETSQHGMITLGGYTVSLECELALP